MSAGDSADPFDIYIYQISDAGPARRSRAGRAAPRRSHASRATIRKNREKTSLRLKRRAAEFLNQAAELRKTVAHLSTPENLLSSTVLHYFESLIPRLASIFEITAHFREGLKKNVFPSGMAGLEFLLRVVKNLNRQIDAALAVAELEGERCRRRAAWFDIYRLLEQASRASQNHYLAGEVSLNVNDWTEPLQVRGKRALWYLAFVDVICRAEELSPRKGIAARVRDEGRGWISVTFVPRGALVPVEESRLRERRQRLLGRTTPDTDPAFVVTRRLVELLGGKLAVGKKFRSYITPLFTVELPVDPNGHLPG